MTAASEQARRLLTQDPDSTENPQERATRALAWSILALAEAQQPEP